MASRIAGRRMASAGFSLARRSSIRFGPGVGPDEVVFQHGLEVGLLPNLLEKREPHFGIVNRDIARPQHGPAFAFPMRRPKHEPPGNARLRGSSGNRGSRPSAPASGR